jgi:pyruvate dehydrogenase E1 component alpha subunit/2-oxoisovalerate dehydrogenase E1 component alpha subunit
LERKLTDIATMPSTTKLTHDQYVELYYFMLLNRRLEDRLVKLFRQNKIVGGVYLSLGQEAVSIGTAYALEPRDWLAPMIRNIGSLLVKGFKPRDIFTQHMAKYTSPTQGKDGTSHFGDLKMRHVVSPISMLGDLIPVMTGVAMAGRYLGQNIVAMTWIGDGGSSTGAFHEGLNLAAQQRAPFVLIIENNQWAYSTPVARQVPLRNLADRAAAYGIAATSVDGNDVIAVYDAAKSAVDQCRAGRGPCVVEVKTMRMKGHAQHDAAEYVPKAMMDYWKTQDPIARYESYLAEHHLLDSAKKSAIEARIERELDEDQKFAEESPMPPPELAEQGAYCEGCHTIQANWQRPRKEVTPPASSVEAVWKVADFGAFKSSAAPQAVTQHENRQGNGANSSDDLSSAETEIEKQIPLRVPFGRGPKDRSVELERRDKAPERPPRHHKPHKRRRR